MKTTSNKLAARIRFDAKRFRSLKQEILQLDYFCKGTVFAYSGPSGPLIPFEVVH